MLSLRRPKNFRKHQQDFVNRRVGQGTANSLKTDTVLLQDGEINKMGNWCWSLRAVFQILLYLNSL